ncbi:MAG: FmdB family zinc ribbon protein [Candidatus Acidiferrales bacterium]
MREVRGHAADSPATEPRGVSLAHSARDGGHAAGCSRGKILFSGPDGKEFCLPLFEYKCPKCGHQFEKIEAFSASKTKKCPKCGGKATRMAAAPAIQFKGSGWYVTDYAGKNSAASSSEGGESKPATPAAPAGDGGASKKTAPSKETQSKDAPSKSKSKND